MTLLNSVCYYGYAKINFFKKGEKTMTIREVINMLAKIFTELFNYLAPLFEKKDEAEGESAEA